jgi:hypothetical protein
MKRIFTLLALAAFALTIFAQSPDLMTYQAVLRDAENHLLTNQSVAIQLSILQTTPNGTSVYTEIHTLNTNANGLVSLEIGDGVSGDDFSLIDWSAGPFYLKSETDPAGGTNYSITTTTQLLSVPYAKYADKAGNAFSGDYGDLTGAPTNVGSFTNDAGYLTSELWSQDGSNLFYSGGNVGIGTSTPGRLLTLNSGATSNYTAFQNNATGISNLDGLLVGIATNLDAFLWNWEAGSLSLGTDNTSRMFIESEGDIGIGTSNPTSNLQVVGDTKFGSSGIGFTEIREITGTTQAASNYTQLTLPSGYNETNTRVLSLEINYNGDRWVGLGFNLQSATPIFNVSYLLNGTGMYIYYPDIAPMQSKAYRILIMQIAP